MPNWGKFQHLALSWTQICSWQLSRCQESIITQLNHGCSPALLQVSGCGAVEGPVGEMEVGDAKVSWVHHFDFSLRKSSSSFNCIIFTVLFAGWLQIMSSYFTTPCCLAICCSDEKSYTGGWKRGGLCSKSLLFIFWYQFNRVANLLFGTKLLLVDPWTLMKIQCFRVANVHRWWSCSHCHPCSLMDTSFISCRRRASCFLRDSSLSGWLTQLSRLPSVEYLLSSLEHFF